MIVERATSDDYRLLNTQLDEPNLETVFNHSRSDSDRAILFSSSAPIPPNLWKPTLVIDPSLGYGSMAFTALDVVPLKPGSSFHLKDSYAISSVAPRSYFNILQQYQIGYTFVFSWPVPENDFFQRISGMRQVSKH